MYRAHYCAGCHALREFGGRPLSVLTTYDQTFLLLVVGSLLQEKEVSGQPVDRGCTAFPLRRVAVHSFPASIREQVAALSTVLVDAKLADDVQDERRRLSRVGRWLIRRSVRRAESVLFASGFGEAVPALASRQAELETRAASGGVSLDELCGPTRTMLAEVFAHAGRITARTEIESSLRALGSDLGEVIYLLDATEDIEKDRRNGCFNAIDAVGIDTGRLWPRLDAAIDRIQRGLQDVALDERLVVVERVIEQLRLRVRSAIERHASVEDRPVGWVRQAGECDVCCAGAECCVAGEACGGACDCCVCTATDWFVCNEERRAARRRKREERRDARRSKREERRQR